MQAKQPLNSEGMQNLTKKNVQEAWGGEDRRSKGGENVGFRSYGEVCGHRDFLR